MVILTINNFILSEQKMELANLTEAACFHLALMTLQSVQMF